MVLRHTTEFVVVVIEMPRAVSPSVGVPAPSTVLLTTVMFDESLTLMPWLVVFVTWNPCTTT